MEAKPAAPALPEQPRLRGVRSMDLPNEFEISVPVGADREWMAVNPTIGVTVYPSVPATVPTSKNFPDGRPIHLWKANRLKAAMTENAYKEQWLVGELNGVFVHVRHDPLTGAISIVVADTRLD